MLLLGLADFNATREMGPILALGMAVMVLAGLTLLPAVLAALGHRVFWPARRGRERAGVWRRAARLVERRPGTVAIAVTALLVAGALGNLGGRESLDFTEAFRDDPDSVEGVRQIAESFPPGRTAPVDLVMTEELSGEVIVPLGELPKIASANWNAASLPTGGDPLVKGELILDLDPFSREATDFVPRLRAEIDRLLAGALELRGGASGDELAVVGGLVAESYDTERAVAADTRLIVPLALALIFVVLALLLRAVVAPLYLIATVVLSFLFALGVGSLVFTHVMGQPGSDPSLAVFAFIFLVGLGVDYNIFLVGRIQEERRGGLDTRRAVLGGLARTGGVITSAGLILAGTFSALMALTFEALFQFGFVIALGLLVDTFVVRALLVPSIAYLLGERNWWPSAREA
jgi:putative drug exporter of the RND superfamily